MLCDRKLSISELTMKRTFFDTNCPLFHVLLIEAEHHCLTAPERERLRERLREREREREIEREIERD